MSFAGNVLMACHGKGAPRRSNRMPPAPRGTTGPSYPRSRNPNQQIVIASASTADNKHDGLGRSEWGDPDDPPQWIRQSRETGWR